jgi:hypothetical protein
MADNPVGIAVDTMDLGQKPVPSCEAPTGKDAAGLNNVLKRARKTNQRCAQPIVRLRGVGLWRQVDPTNLEVVD